MSTTIQTNKNFRPKSTRVRMVIKKETTFNNEVHITGYCSLNELLPNNAVIHGMTLHSPDLLSALCAGLVIPRGCSCCGYSQPVTTLVNRYEK